MDSFEKARVDINQIDSEMARLFEKRMHAVEIIAANKKEKGLPVKDAGRELNLINRNLGFISSEELKPYYLEFIKKTIALSCEYQERIIKNKDAE